MNYSQLNKTSSYLLAFCLLLLNLPASASEDKIGLPRMELGVSMFALRAPDYRGSSHSQNYLLPIPYIKFRSKRLLVDDGIQGLFLNSKDLILSISANASLPVDGDNPDREGMPNLDASIEIGPSLEYRLLKHQLGETWIEIPLRFGFTIDTQPESIGWVLNPKISWRKASQHLGEWKLRAAFGVLYSTELYHDYYYQVKPEQATTSRSVFDAEAGFSGSRTEFSFSRRYGQLWFGGFVRYDDLNNSVVEDSPLVSDSSNLMVGVALGWVFRDYY